MEDVMSQIKSIALAALFGIGVAGLSGNLANAASPTPAQANNPAQSQVYAQANRSELSLRLAREPAPTSNPSVTGSGVHIQSRAGFVGYH